MSSKETVMARAHCSPYAVGTKTLFNGGEPWHPAEQPAFPTLPWEEMEHPAAPDYANLASWSAHPDMVDFANEFLVDGEPAIPPISERLADCFFIRATIMGRYFSQWHSPIGDPVIDERSAVQSLEASVVNDTCRIFAPRFRCTCIPAHNHLHHPSMEMRRGAPEEYWKGAQKAMDLAYSDLDRAFDQFVEWTGDRPIVLMGVSQGGHLVQRLMERFHRDKVLLDRLVCCYVMGACGTFAMDKFARNFPSIKPCSGPLDTGCIVSFDNITEDCLVGGGDGFSIADKGLSEVPGDCPPIRNKGSDPFHLARYVGENGEGVWESLKGKKMYCTNPLTWTQDVARADASLHLGRFEVNWVQADGETPMPFPARHMTVVGACPVNARKVDTGCLWAEIAHNGGCLMTAPYGDEPCRHCEVEDFYFNTRENCRQRVGAFLEAREG